MFTKLCLKNFKGFKDFQIDFREGKTKKEAKKIILLFGENGVGKSSIIDAFKVLSSTIGALIDLRSFNESLTEEDLEVDEHSSVQRTFRIDYLIKGLKSIGSNGEMLLSFEGYIKSGRGFKYEMIFDKGAIISEKLLLDKKAIFVASEKSLQIEDIGKSSELLRKLHEYKNLYFGKFTFLSCLCYLKSDLSENFKQDFIEKDLIYFLNEISDIDIFNPKDNRYQLFAYIDNDDLLPNLVSGVYNPWLKDKINYTKAVLSKFMSSFFMHIVSVDYEISPINENKNRYSLVFKENNGGTIVSVPYSLESTGIKKTVALFSYLYEVNSSTSTFLLDEVDSGLGCILFEKIINSLDIERMKGQLILTTHDVFLLKEKMKRNIYLLDRDENFDVKYVTLDSFKRKIQPKTDVIGKYIKGDFGGVYAKDNLSFDEMLSFKRQKTN